MTDKNKTKKFISGLLIVSILLPSVLLSFPQKGYAIWGVTNPAGDGASVAQVPIATANLATNATTLATTLKDWGLKVLEQLLKAAAKRVLAEMTKSVINWINNDFHGSPLFLENPGSFFNDIAKSGLKDIVDRYGYNDLLYPFGKQFALDAINMYKSTLESNSRFTLSQVMTQGELVGYRNNFSYGGWNGFLTNTQFPQNNVVGFRLEKLEELANDVRGTQQSAAEGVQSMLSQGLGFLSPEKCATNLDFNDFSNQFSKPKFDDATYAEKHPWPELADSEAENRARQTKYYADRDAAKAEWGKKNDCPPKKDGSPGFEKTTPGSVVSSSISNSLNMPFLQTALDGAMGNSLSAILDALVGHFLEKGLSALASKVNPPKVQDDWSYNGQTIGSPVDENTNSPSPWNVGPDQEVLIGDFKQEINQKINSLATELRLMYNEDVNNPGIYQMYAKVWPKAQELDDCIPGPDVMGLQERFDAEVTRQKGDVTEKGTGMMSMITGDKSETTDKIGKELTTAMSTYKDWLDSKMMPELPSSLVYIDAVKNIKTLSQGMSQLTADRITKNTSLARLQAIKQNLNASFPDDTQQPETGSIEEKALVAIWKQYQGVSPELSNTNTIESTRNKLSEAKDMYNNFLSLLNPSNPVGCPAERLAKGWTNPSASNMSAGNATHDGKKEIDLFCTLPIRGGKSHLAGGMDGNPYYFMQRNTPTYPELLVINTSHVFQYVTVTIQSFLGALASSFSTVGGQLAYPNGIFVYEWWNTEINCSTLFQASPIEYKGELPGNLRETPLYPGSPETLGNCRYSNGVIDAALTTDECAQNSGTWEELKPLGTCTVQIPNRTPPLTVPIPNTLQSECTTASGIWEENV